MADWRDRLKQILSREGAAAEVRSEEVEEWRNELADFFDSIVMPAFRELKTELEKHGRKVEIDKGGNQASLTVFHGDEEEFSYGIRGAGCHRMSFAFPAFDPVGGPKIAYATVSHPGEPGRERRVQTFTKERVIQDFLEDYARWRGW